MDSSFQPSLATGRSSDPTLKSRMIKFVTHVKKQFTQFIKILLASMTYNCFGVFYANLSYKFML